MNIKKSLESRIRGWLPKEPMLPKRFANNASEKPKAKPPKNKGSRAALVIVYALFAVFLGVTNFSTRQYSVAIAYWASAIAILLFAYFFYKYNFVIRPRIGFGVILLALGILFLFLSGAAEFFFGFFAIFTVPYFSSVPIVVTFLVALLIGLIFVILGLWLERELNFKQLLTKRRLLPYAVATLLIFSTHIVIISSVEFEYAVPATFLAMGILVLMGLRRFTVTTTALGLLLVCTLIFGSAAAGYYTVTYVNESRYLTTAQAPDVNTINLHVRTLEGDIRVYFVNTANPICHIDFVKEYGAIAQGNGVQFHDKSAYVGEPETTFNYTVENSVVNITAIASTVLVNITLSENYKVNLNFFTYFGAITINRPPNQEIIQSTNFTSKWGYVTYK